MNLQLQVNSNEIIEEIIELNKNYKKEIKEKVIIVENDMVQTEIRYILTNKEMVITFEGVGSFGDYYQLLKKISGKEMYSSKISDALKKEYDLIKYDFNRKLIKMYKGQNVNGMLTHNIYNISFALNKWSIELHEYILSKISHLIYEENKVVQEIGGYSSDEARAYQVKMNEKAKERIVSYKEEALKYRDLMSEENNEKFLALVKEIIKEDMHIEKLADNKTIIMKNNRYTMIFNMFYARIINNRTAIEEDVLKFLGEEMYWVLKNNQKTYLRLQEAIESGLKDKKNHNRVERLYKLITRYFEVMRFKNMVSINVESHTLKVKGVGLQKKKMNFIVHPQGIFIFSEKLYKSGRVIPTFEIVYIIDGTPNLELLEEQGLSKGNTVQLFSIFMVGKDLKKEIEYLNQ